MELSVPVGFSSLVDIFEVKPPLRMVSAIEYIRLFKSGRIRPTQGHR
jgi:hypothetical protein